MFTRQLTVLALAFGFAIALGACSSNDELSAPSPNTDPTVENTDSGAVDPVPSGGAPEAPRDPATNPADPTAPTNPTAPANPANPTDPAGEAADDPMGNPSL